MRRAADPGGEWVQLSSSAAFRSTVPQISAESNPVNEAREEPSHRAPLGPFAAVRWAKLSRAVGLAPDTPVALALSGGADSVYLLHVVAAARPRPRVIAIHVEHGLRGAEGDLDRDFCAATCARLGVEFVVRKVQLDASAPSLEARAREARYDALFAVAREKNFDVVATGHHADDALETLMQRWIRGTDLAGLAGLKPSVAVDGPMRGSSRSKPKRTLLNTADMNTSASNTAPSSAERPRASELVPGPRPLRVVRPLIALRREEVRQSLVECGLAWREDGSNQSDRFTRNRVRHDFLPKIAAIAGPEAIENLRAFGAAVEELEERCAERTAHLVWSPPVHAEARRGAHDVDLGGSIARAELMVLARPLVRRALWRLATEGTGASPSRALLDRIVDDLVSGRCALHVLPGGWTLQLRSDVLWLEPPPRARIPLASRHAPRTIEVDGSARQLDLFEMGARAEPLAQDSAELPLPGAVRLSDGRIVCAEIVEVPLGSDVLRAPLSVEIDARDLAAPLCVRWPRPGDRFHGLGAPGSKPLARFLADAGVPRHDRARVPLVFAGDELVWVAGIRPCERRRVARTTQRRLRLTLRHPMEIEGAGALDSSFEIQRYRREPSLFDAHVNRSEPS